MALPPNNNYLYGNTNLPNNNDQMAFAPGSKNDKTLKSLYEMKSTFGDTPAYKQLREKDVEQFNKGKEPLSLPAEEYKGIKGYTANAAGYPGATMTDANSYITRKTPTDTFQSMFQNADTGRYSTNQNFNSNNIFQSGFNRGANQNYGITGAPMYLDNPEEEFNPGTMYTTNKDSSFADASLIPNSSAPGFDNRFSGIMRNTVARPLMFQGGVQAGMGLSKALGITNPFLALAGGIGSQFLPLNNRPSNLDYDYVNQPGGISVVDNKIRGGVLEGKNFASGFGSNDLGQMYQDYIDKMEEEEELTKGQTQKLKDARAELRSYLTTGPKMSGYETPDEKRMTAKEFAFNYNQGIGQFAQPDYDQLDSQDYGGGYSEETGNYEDTYDPGTVD